MGTEHTPVPWHQGPHYKADIHSAHGQVATCTPLMSPLAKANAAFIVRAVNSHADLIAALEEIIMTVPKIVMNANAKVSDSPNIKCDYNVAFIARAALLKAKGA